MIIFYFFCEKDHFNAKIAIFEQFLRFLKEKCTLLSERFQFLNFLIKNHAFWGSPGWVRSHRRSRNLNSKFSRKIWFSESMRFCLIVDFKTPFWENVIKFTGVVLSYFAFLTFANNSSIFFHKKLAICWFNNPLIIL